MDQDRPNQNANKEPAEGSRDTARERETMSRERHGSTASEQAGGITNRPLEREAQEQHEVPPRGRTKDEDRNA